MVGRGLAELLLRGSLTTNGTLMDAEIFSVGNSHSGIQGVHCFDYHGRVIPRGVHYVPGPDACLHCVCDEGGPTLCRAMLCQPPQMQNCIATRVGNSCCDFVCQHDPDWKREENDLKGKDFDIGVIIPKVVIYAMLSLICFSLLLFLINRNCKREMRGRRMANIDASRRARQMCDESDDTRSLDFSIYYERNRNMSSYPPQYMSWWKPPVSHFPPTCEAPPPYEETITSTSNIIPVVSGYDTITIIPPTSHSEQAPTTMTNQVTDSGAVQASVDGPRTTSMALNSKPDVEYVETHTGSASAQVQPLSIPSTNQSGESAPPVYSELDATSNPSIRIAFKRSLTLPHRPISLFSEKRSNNTGNGFDRHQQRHSLQLDVADWNSSGSSSLSLTPTTPVLRNPEPISSSSYSSETNTPT